MPRTRSPFPLVVIALPIALLAGCAAPQAEYPSLAVRDVERVSGSMEVQPVAPLPAPDAATLGSLDGILAQARAAQAEFAALTPAARGVVAAASGQPRGSDSWSRAQIAVAQLESRRSRTMIAMADLDRLYVSAATDGADPAQIAGVRAEVEGIVEHQSDLIDTLLSMIAS